MHEYKRVRNCSFALHIAVLTRAVFTLTVYRTFTETNSTSATYTVPPPLILCFFYRGIVPPSPIYRVCVSFGAHFWALKRHHRRHVGYARYTSFSVFFYEGYLCYELDPPTMEEKKRAYVCLFLPWRLFALTPLRVSITSIYNKNLTTQPLRQLAPSPSRRRGWVFAPSIVSKNRIVDNKYHTSI